MKDQDYYRYYHELVVVNQVIFPNVTVLFEFVSKLISLDYKAFLGYRMWGCMDTGEMRDLMQREASEPRLVELYVSTFLSQELEKRNTLWNRLKTKFSNNRNGSKICFDANDNTELYEFVLKKLSQGDTVSEVFDKNIRYVINGNILYRYI